MEPVDVVKKGRGRPKGSLNRKTIALQARIDEMKEKTTSSMEDVSFEEDKSQVDKPRPKRKTHIVPDEPDPVIEDVDSEPDPVIDTYLDVDSEPDPVIHEPVSWVPVSRPKRKTRKRTMIHLEEEEAAVEEIPKPKRKPKAVVATKPMEPPTYLEVLRRGIDVARQQRKADQVAKYDSFFRY